MTSICEPYSVSTTITTFWKRCNVLDCLTWSSCQSLSVRRVTMIWYGNTRRPTCKGVWNSSVHLCNNQLTEKQLTPCGRVTNACYLVSGCYKYSYRTSGGGVSVSVVSRLQAGQWSNRFSIRGRYKGFFFSPKHLDWSRAHPASYIMGSGAFFPYVTWPRHEADCSSHCVLRLRMRELYLYPLHDMHRTTLFLPQSTYV